MIHANILTVVKYSKTVHIPVKSISHVIAKQGASNDDPFEVVIANGEKFQQERGLHDLLEKLHQFSSHAGQK